MVKITAELVRKRAEHNDMELSSLEELSLHQMNLEKIEHLDRWCPKLKILLLQGNIISTIENLCRLKELEYLNLALNNIETVCGLENCEALKKLDLTANFIIDLQSLKCLQGLTNLQELYLTGNPCTKYTGYRTWVMNHLPTLKELDGVEILRSERLKSKQKFEEVNSSVKEEESKAFGKRQIQKLKYESETEKEFEDTQEEIERWSEEITDNSPEVRTAMSNEIQRRRERHNNKGEKRKEKKEIKFFTNDGVPLNMNKANLEFTFKDDEDNNAYILEVKTYRYLSGEHLTCDVQPTYVRVTVKGLPLQLAYPSEVKSGQASALRSQVTGHLVITAPKFEEGKLLSFPKDERMNKENRKKINKEEGEKQEKENERTGNSNYLEVNDGNPDKKWFIESEFGSVHYNCNQSNTKYYASRNFTTPERSNSPTFVDNPEVPPLE